MSDLNDLMPTTPDLNKERLEQLKKLMPDLFTNDGRLNVDELKRVVDPELVSESERFEFRWFGKAAAKRAAFTPSTAALQHDGARSVNLDAADGNMIIEGENLEALKCLLSAYREKVKCIYIDPPYNTGNDFVYNDNYNETRKAYWEQTGTTEEGVKVDTNTASDGRYHSNWLNMIYPRLLVARQLLREDGVIFISIDDNEVHQLRKVCDEVFGEECFLAKFVWKCRQFTDARSISHISTDHEYVLAYAKSDAAFFRGTERDESKYGNPDNDSRGLWMSRSILGLATKDQRPNLHYEIEDPKSGHKFSPPETTGWRYSRERMDKLISEGCILFPASPKGRPREKKFREDLSNEFTSFPTIIDNVFTSAGTSEIREIFGTQVFDFPKPMQLIKRLVAQIAEEGDTVLDFFSGSGPTGHAVMELNKEDGGNRNFIMVQLPELTDEKSEAYKAGYKKISDITIERNKRVIARIEKEQAEADKTKGLFDGEKEPYRPGFKVYRLVKSHFPRCEFAPDPEKSTKENIELLKAYITAKEATLYSLFNEADIFDEVMLKNGFMLSYARTRMEEFAKNNVYLVRDAFKQALVCLDAELNEETIAQLKGRCEVFICLERAVDTTKKWNLKQMLGERLVAF